MGTDLIWFETDEFNGQVKCEVAWGGQRSQGLARDEIPRNGEHTDLATCACGSIHIEAKVIASEDRSVDQILQREYLADETGAIRFFIRKSSDATPLLKDRWLRYWHVSSSQSVREH
jgi:hypothetical protein